MFMTCIYVRLLNEGTEVFRPVDAEEVAGGLFKLLSIPDYDSSVEEWEFQPGDIVSAERRIGQNDDFLLAVKA